MNLEVLVSTMNQNDFSLVEKMNIKNKALIINQGKKQCNNQIIKNGNKIRIITYNEKGLSKSRNRAIENMEADIGLFADDDIIYCDDYYEKIVKAHKKYEDADIIAFRVIRGDELRKKNFRHKLHWENYLTCLKISSVEISFKLRSIRKKKLKFNEYFGAGSDEFLMGEENIFLYNALDKGLNILYLPEKIGKLKNNRSSWFKGYNKNYFLSRGASYYAMNNRWYIFLILQFAIRKYNRYKEKLNFIDALKFMLRGVKDYKKL